MALAHADSGEVINIRPFDDAFGEHKSTALVKTDDLELIRIVLGRGRTIPPHAVNGPVVLQCLQGHVELSIDELAVELKSGELVHLARGATHALRAVEDSSLLLTIVFVQ